MANVNVSINAILLYCDESIVNLNIGNGYTIRKVYLDDFVHKGKICDGNGRLSVDYLGSRICSEDEKISLMCLSKDEVFQIQPPEIQSGIAITDNDLRCSEQIEDYQEKECTFLNDIFSMLRLYKKGNIGTKQIFFEYQYTMMGFFNFNDVNTSNNVTRNIVDSTVYTLNVTEIPECNNFIARVTSKEFLMLKHCIDEFMWGLEQIDIPTAFEQHTTALEMMLLETNQRYKKEALSKRVSVLLESNNTDIVILYNKIKNYYRYRSESLHEGDGSNITQVELKKIEDIVRRILNKYLDFCRSELQNNPLESWSNIKSKKINDLKTIVTTLISGGILPN